MLVIPLPVVALVLEETVRFGLAVASPDDRASPTPGCGLEELPERDPHSGRDLFH